MRTIGELVLERQVAQARSAAAQAAEPAAAPERPAAAPVEPARWEALRAEYRDRGRKLFAAFDERQRRLLEAEIVMAQGKRNPEERHRLALTVRALREWIRGARDLGLLPEFEREIRQFVAYLKHEAEEAARAEKVELPWKMRLFIESGTDVTAPVKKPVQLDYDPARCNP